jgi:hypothetical protein
LKRIRFTLGRCIKGGIEFLIFQESVRKGDRKM